MLNRRWARWKQSQVRKLMATGLSANAALHMARTEARYRQQIAPIIGLEAANNARLICLDENAGRFGLEGTLAGISETQIDRLCAAGARLVLLP